MPEASRRCRSFPLRELLAHTRLDFLESIRTTRRVPRRPAVRLHTVELPMRHAPGGLAGLIGGPRPLLLGGGLEGGTASGKHGSKGQRISIVPSSGPLRLPQHYDPRVDGGCSRYIVTSESLRGLAPILQQPVDDGTAVTHLCVGPVHSCWPLGRSPGLCRSPGLHGGAWTAADGRRRDWLLPHNHRRGRRLGDRRSKPFHG